MAAVDAWDIELALVGFLVSVLDPARTPIGRGRDLDYLPVPERSCSALCQRNWITFFAC